MQKYPTKTWFSTNNMVIKIPDELIHNKKLKMNFERNMILTIAEDGKSVIITNIDSHFDNIKDSLSK